MTIVTKPQEQIESGERRIEHLGQRVLIRKKDNALWDLRYNVLVDARSLQAS